MNIIPSFDYFNILYEIEVNGKCCVPLISHRHNYAVFVSTECYEKLPKIGFNINKENKDILNYSNYELRKLVCSDRIIRIYSRDENHNVKTIMYVINSSFYERRMGEILFQQD